MDRIKRLIQSGVLEDFVAVPDDIACESCGRRLVDPPVPWKLDHATGRRLCVPCWDKANSGRRRHKSVDHVAHDCGNVRPGDTKG